MEIVKIIEKQQRIYSNVFEESFSVEELLNGKVLKKLTESCQQRKYEGGFFYDLSLNDKEVYQLTHLFSEKLNIPFGIFDPHIELEEKLKQISDHHEWTVTYFNYPKGKEEYSIESLLTVGNGYFGLRGTTPEMTISKNNYPATYIAGVYNTQKSKIGESIVENEDFVNLPNSQKIYLIVEGERIDIESNQIDYLHRELNLKTGELTTTSKILLKTGTIVEIKSKKIVSMANKHFYGIDYQFKVSNKKIIVQLVSEIDGDVFNYNVERYRKLENKHLVINHVCADGPIAKLDAATNTSGINIYMQSQLTSQTIDLSQLENDLSKNKIRQIVNVNVESNQWYGLEKIVYVAKDNKDEEVVYPNYLELYQASKKEWGNLWKKASIQVSGDMMSQKMLNLHTYHILSSGSPIGNKKQDASITARGLHGEAYRGHIFWDELFILPFYILHFPETAKELLMYRYNRLEMAKKLAQAEGYEGAMYPWQSGLDGSEQSQRLHLNPLSGEWKEDHSRRQRHVSLAIAYNIWMYYLQTEDSDFLTDFGLEMLVEISRFWLSMAVFDSKTQRFSINGVMGPDEFHEAYPNQTKGGLNNNAYTNLMVTWLFGVMLTLKETYQMTNKLDWKRLNEVKKNLHLDINEEGIIGQFDGYFDLKEIDWSTYQSKYSNIYRMDRILNAEGKSADDYKVAKQADSLMIFYNLQEETVTKLLSNLSYSLPKDYVKKNLLYYLARTSHGSTLSRVVHAQLAEMVDDRELAWKLYQEALYSDFRDIQGGTTAEGIHTGVMASTLFITLSAFAGLDVRNDVVKLEPHLPEQWESLSFSFQNKGSQFQVRLTHSYLEIDVNQDQIIEINGQKLTLEANKKKVVEY